MKTNPSPIFWASLAGIICSTLIAAFQTNFFANRFTGLAFWNYWIPMGILVAVVIRRFSFKVKLNRPEWLAILALFNLNCFILNNEVGLFSPQALWVYGALGAMYFFVIIDYFWKNAPIWFSGATQILIGLGIFISLYFTLYMVPLMPIGVIAIVVFGLGVHVFIPLALLITLVVIASKKLETTWNYTFVGVGFAIPILLIIGLSIFWLPVKSSVEERTSQGENHLLPKWVRVAQKIPNNYFSKLYLTGDFRFDNLDNFGLVNSWNIATSDLGRVHDPIINLASFILGEAPLQPEERLKILKTALSSRHQTERKLWTGRDLTIQKAHTDITIYTEFRLAYTEKTFFIKNNSWDRSEMQEALFTFYLPEGSTSSSMSLWVNGEERPSRLTTKEKADRAYVAIVGRERRDPALLHWQEGNRLTLTVFPCTNSEIRQVKVGFTTPLQMRNGNLHYDNIQIEGPYLSGKENTLVTIIGQNNLAKKPSGFKQLEAKRYTQSRSFKKDWSFAFTPDKVNSASFSFRGSCYHLESLQQTLTSIVPENIYLDINSSWKKGTFNQLLDAFPEKQFYVFAGKELVSVTDENRDQIFKNKARLRFSIFPVNLVSNPEKSLVITSRGDGTPYFKDLDHAHRNALEKDGSSTSTLQVACLTSEVPGYLRHFEYANRVNIFSTSIKELRQLISQKEIPNYLEKENSIILKENGTRIVKSDHCPTSEAGPDHLLRLFHYNTILKQYANQGATDSLTYRGLLQAANEAFVVSPVSSLIVLETQNDYERFGIEENKKSLKNAKKVTPGPTPTNNTADVDLTQKGLNNVAAKNTGAAPEPHEWALILVGLLLLLWVYRKI